MILIMMLWRVHSAVGSAQPCHGWGRGFESRCTLHALVVQLAECLIGIQVVAGSIPAQSSSWRSSMEERLLRTQQVGGSSPFASSSRCSLVARHLICNQETTVVGGSIPSTGSRNVAIAEMRSRMTTRFRQWAERMFYVWGVGIAGNTLALQAGVVGSYPTRSTILVV